MLPIQKAEIRRIRVRSQVEQIVHKTLSRKNPSQKKGLVEWPEFKPQYHTQTNKKATALPWQKKKKT
jgi:hypothetical protein